MPTRLRPAIVALYHFARAADDIADEGDLSDAERLSELKRFDDALRIAQSPADHAAAAENGVSVQQPAVVARLHPHIVEHDLPIQELRALIDAFSQDVHVKRYPNHAALLDYCRRSASPIGRLLLRLFRIDDAERLGFSDRICSALQLINFLQDVAIDWRKGRVYLPLEPLAAAGASEQDIAAAVATGRPAAALRRAMLAECDFAGELLAAGTPLIQLVPWQLSLELRAIIAGGRRILNRIIKAEGDVFSARPRLGWRDGPALLRLAIVPAR